MYLQAPFKNIKHLQNYEITLIKTNHFCQVRPSPQSSPNFAMRSSLDNTSTLDAGSCVPIINTAIFVTTSQLHFQGQH